MENNRTRQITIGQREFPLGVRTYIVGVINITPDSFSDGGLYLDPGAAAERAQQLVQEGADIIDIGAESTRPGSLPLDAEEELKRLLPALRKVRAAVSVPLSVDTYKSVVASAALAEGADMVNDISGLMADPNMASVIAQAGAPAILMHRRPFTDPYPGNVWDDIIPYLERSIHMAVEAGIPREQIVVDPGFGFGKTDRQNLQIVRELGRLRVLDCPVLLGPSRKSTIGRTLELPVNELVEGTAAIVALAIAQGVDFVRVHDVQAIARCARMADAVIRIVNGRTGSQEMPIMSGS